ncbi:hypothetical protein PHMEG_00011504 [Phytophthora megakarya]|uniref:Reverse transcriptase Ty1/copia-type domain-containing protein n=1 Tax=Phytophthora megakarya TaxID=4795 RepID=A0A225WC26_9STRA|nr:hypothetical protein PHMEG_00011504 [Phytophthora megakarya]
MRDEHEPRDCKLLNTKLVYKTKTHADGTVERRKGRLVACGNEQVYGVDYTDTISAVLDMTTGKVIFVLAHIWGVPARHGDVPSAYVKADKEDHIEIFLHISKDMVLSVELLALLGVKHKRELELRLIKSLYGLKLAGRLWNLLLHKTLVELGYCQCYTDSCLYFKRDAGGVTLVGVYVDDLLVTGTSNERVETFFKEMVVLELKGLGVVSKFLGIGFEYDKDKGWLVEQRQVIQDLLDKFGLASASAVRVPIGGENDNESEGDLLPKHGAGNPERPTVQTFQSLVGSLLWIARCTRPDIAFAAHRVTRRTHAPRVNDWRLAKKIARYLKGTIATKFAMSATDGNLNKDKVRVEAYSNGDYAGDRVDRKSVTGGVLLVSGMVVGWLCKKQDSVVLSTMEAEFVAASQVTAEMLGIAELLGEIGLKVEMPYKLHVDNQATIKQIQGEDTSGRAKHIDVTFKFDMDLSREKALEINYCESKAMRADILTKTLPAPRLEELRSLVMLTTCPHEKEC